MEKETLEAKLRNQLTPIYGLADLVLLLDLRPEIKHILVNQAKQVMRNKQSIHLILQGIEAKIIDKPDLLRMAFDAGRERIKHPDWGFVWDDFDDWLQRNNKK